MFATKHFDDRGRQWQGKAELTKPGTASLLVRHRDPLTPDCPRASLLRSIVDPSHASPPRNRALLAILFHPRASLSLHLFHESPYTIIDNFFPRLLCIAQTEGEYMAVFDFVQAVYAGEGVETIINMWGEPEVFMRVTWKVLADGKWEGVQSLEVEEDAENIMKELIYRVDVHRSTDAATASSR
ncbi:hypothetical protein ARMGADRAFT_1083835 [Armillaria gallica]|uniref:Uncharacterized protein n=1 Tax=Armillaria gallica TaxID=47427 RepID=A0A2H3DEL9_ARMGA|nr:hypothetical protein ARMGADRAFT_1083835 [Armillaria gallica]